MVGACRTYDIVEAVVVALRIVAHLRQHEQLSLAQVEVTFETRKGETGSAERYSELRAVLFDQDVEEQAQHLQVLLVRDDG